MKCKKVFLGILFFSIVLLITSSSFAKAGKAQQSGPVPSIVAKWIDAMMRTGEGLNGIITSDFQYTQYSFDFDKRLFRGAKGDLPFFAKKSKPTEIELLETRPGQDGGYVAVLRATAESGLYRSWEIHLFVRPDGVAAATEVAMEGTFEGYPPGCPETAFKRDLLVTLHSSPTSSFAGSAVTLYNFRRDTDSLDYAKPGADEKMLKYCSPKPDTYLVESEVLVFGRGGQLEVANTMATKHKAEDQEDATGALFVTENGVNYPGRLINIGNGNEGLMLTYAVDRGPKTEMIEVAKLYEYKGKSFRPVWGYDVGRMSSSGAPGNAGQYEWALKSSTDPSGNPMITARLETNDDEKFSCPQGTVVTYTKKGSSSFKPDKQGIPGSCIKSSSMSDSSLRSNAKEDKGPSYTGVVQEIDWRFQK